MEFTMVLLLRVLIMLMSEPAPASSAWCVARSDATQQALQTALDYACSSGSADCAPIQPSGLCFLPNTVQAHASYAFNSYFQRRGNAPGSCSFAGTANIATTDPSYGSCDYPASPSTAGSGSTTTMPSVVVSPPPPVPVYGDMSPPFNLQDSQTRVQLTDFNTILVILSLSYFLQIMH